MSLSAFLAENAAAVENVKSVVSKRFVGEDGQPVAWEIKAISGSEDEALRRACVKRALVPGRRNQYQRETDYDMYMGKLAAACTVFPNLKNQELQDSSRRANMRNIWARCRRFAALTSACRTRWTRQKTD